MLNIEKSNSIIMSFILSVVMVVSILSKFSFVLSIQTAIFLILILLFIYLVNNNKFKLNSYVILTLIFFLVCCSSYISADFKTNVKNYLLILSSSLMAGFIFSCLSLEFKKKVFFIPVFIALWLSMILFTKFVTNIQTFFYGNNFSDNIALNVNVVASFLVLVYPLIFIFIREQKNTKIFIAIMLFVLFSIFVTGCKIALILSLISTIIFLLGYRKKTYIKVLMAFSGICLIAYVCYEFFLKPDFKSSTESLVLWKTAYLIFKENIFFGCGLGNYSTLFNTFRPELVSGTMFAHNIVMQLLAETGLLGFLSFFILIVSFYFRVITKITEEKDIYFYIYTAISITCFLIMNLFEYSFFVPTNMLLFFIVLSSVFYNKIETLKKNRTNIFVLFFVSACIIAFFIRPVIANTYYKKGIDLYVAGHYKVAIEEFEKAIKFDKKNPEYYMQVSRSYFAIYDKIRNEEGQVYIDKAVEYNKKAIQLHKYDAKLRFSLASFYWNENKKEDALDAIQEALKYDKFNSDYEEYYYQIKNS